MDLATCMLLFQCNTIFKNVLLAVNFGEHCYDFGVNRILPFCTSYIKILALGKFTEAPACENMIVLFFVKDHRWPSIQKRSN